MGLNYIIRLVGGEWWPVLVLALIAMIIIAYKNCYSAKATGQVLYSQGKGFFVILASIAGIFHFCDLMQEWIKEDLILVEEDFGSMNADIASILLAMALGLLVASIFYTAAEIVIKARTDFIENRYMLTHIRNLGRDDENKFY